MSTNVWILAISTIWIALRDKVPSDIQQAQNLITEAIVTIWRHQLSHFQLASHTPIGRWGMAVTAMIWLIKEWVRVFPQSRGEEVLKCLLSLYSGGRASLTPPCATRWLSVLYISRHQTCDFRLAPYLSKLFIYIWILSELWNPPVTQPP